ncbi:protein kinase [candidate division KSB1 bacterium]|nr:protein kinase [candidate division KSB1 bacterium]
MIGQTISHYKIIEKLGGGGMGVVYKAEDTRLKRLVALKFLPLDLTRNEEARLRFINEAQAASALDHPNICTIYEIDETRKGQLFIAMAYCEGGTLRKKVSSNQLSVTSVIDIATQIAQGLATAHQHGIVHRDVKPANVIVTNEGVVKIIDFGLAKLIGIKGLTKASAAMGTVAYMSPEQLRGEVVDHRSDIWSLGVTLYEMATGQLPFREAHELALVYAIMNEKPAPLTALRPDLPRGLQQIVDKAMQEKHDKRYQRLEEMLDDLKLLKKELESASSKRGSATAASPRQKRSYFLGGIAVILFLLLGIGFYLRQHTEEMKGADHADQYRIAVLPLDNFSPDADDEYFADGMTEEFISTLSKIDRFRVIARASVMRYKGGAKNIAELGRELKVGTILAGSVRKAGNKLRITAQLVDVRRQEPIWTEDYDREFKEVFAIQSDIAQRVAQALQTELLANEKRKIGKKATQNLEAYTSYLKGRFFWNKRTPENFAKGMAYFEQAIAQDSCYALAYAGLADSYTILGTVEYGVLPAREAIPKAKAAVEKALACDDQSAEAHASLANIRYTYEWDWSGAEREFKRAIALNPNYTMAHHWYAHYLAARGRFDEAMAEIRLAQELDPLSLIVNTTVGMVFYYRRQPDQAIEQLQQALEIDPDFFAAHLQLGVFFMQQQRFDEAIAEFQKAISLVGENPITLALLGHAYAASGKRSEALAILAQLQQQPLQPFVSPLHLAFVYLGLDEKDRAFEWLEKAYEERANYLIYLEVEPLFDDLRSDPRFAALLKKVGLRP